MKIVGFSTVLVLIDGSRVPHHTAVLDDGSVFSLTVVPWLENVWLRLPSLPGSYAAHLEREAAHMQPLPPLPDAAPAAPQDERAA